MRIGIVIRTADGFWSLTRFEDDRAASYFMALAKDEIDFIRDINIVSCSDEKSPPSDFFPKLSENLYWCPYCGEPRHFFSDSDFPGYLLCEICHVSDAMQSVRYFNHMIHERDKKSNKKSNKGREKK